MSNVLRRKDRTARLLKLQTILMNYPDGIKVEELARICLTSKRTVYRDLKTLENGLDIPLWEEGSKRGIAEGYFLPPINFTQEEAVNIFLAVRLMQSLSYIHNPSIASTFMKLDTIVPPPIKKQIQSTLEHIQKQPRDERKIKNLNNLIRAWLSQKKVKIWYQEMQDEKPVEHIVEPYFIEPSLQTHSNMLIAYCHRNKSIRTFMIDHIVGEVSIQLDTYQVPSDFNPLDYLSLTLDANVVEELITAKLHFNALFSRAISGLIWHPSQTTEVQKDGSIIVTLRVYNNFGFRSWILGWLDYVEVIEPKTLRDQIIKRAQSILDIYSR